MAISKNLKEMILNNIEKINITKKIRMDIEDIYLESSSTTNNEEYNTISYKLGKALIDAKKDVPTALSTPKKLYALYLESQNRSIQRNITKQKSKTIEKSYEVLQQSFEYKRIEDFYIEPSDDYTINFSNLKDTFGIKSGEKVYIVDENKVFFHSDECIPIYTTDEKLHKITLGMKQGINLNFSIEKSKNLDIVVIICFYDEKTKERISYNMLPINKVVNAYFPKNSGYFNLGLKVIGEGFAKHNDIAFNNLCENAFIDDNIDLEEGVSIIIPSYKGQDTIIDTLKSIANQKNIEFKLLEIIIIINGEKDSTEDKVLEFSSKHPYLNIDCEYISSAGASKARNIAIAKAKKKFMVFCDDDDLLSEEYIAGLYEIRSPDSIGFCQIYDLETDDVLVKNNTINTMLLSALDENIESINRFTSAITMIASKIVPTKNIQKISFNESLRSGEDVAFFTEYYVKYSPSLVMSSNQNTYYIRRLRNNSVSRQELSFDFNISQRLDVIKDLILLKKTITNRDGFDFVDTKIRAQCSFIVNYLNKYPEEYRQLHLQIINKGIQGFPYRYLQDKLGLIEPDLLVVSYCHPPFVDTSAVVSAKRVFEFNQICDIICADMSKVREVNTELYAINQHLVRDSFVVDTPPTFGGWSGIYHFCQAVITLSKGKQYGSIYSRSFWPASHFAAFEYKRKNPDVKWIAEFSDPVILDIEGNIRHASIPKEWVEKVVTDFDLNDSLKQEYNLYIWCELVAYLFADEIIFTCSNQKDLMLNNFPYKESLVNAKGSIKTIPHPTLPPEYYNRSSVMEYDLDLQKVNFAYFGAFYKTRRLDDLIESLYFYHSNIHQFENMKEPLVHIFTEQVEVAKDMVNEEGLSKYFVINEYVDYFDFLKISKSMDVLIVNDSKAKDIFGYNPYMPSKLSDYLGSESKIWMFCEEGSAMDQLQNIGGYKSYITKNPSKALIEILADIT